MKRSGNNEIDLLLRRLGGRGGGEESVDGDSSPETGRHLDADELSAYAENTLPPAARVRYTEHVAYCARCRKIVTQLAVSAGVAPPPAEPGLERSAFSRFLASLFAPAVLRYAVPSLAAVVILGLGLMMFRYRAEKGSVALNERVASPVVSTSAPASDSATQAETHPEQAKSVNGGLAYDSVKPADSKSAPVREDQTKALAQAADKNAKAEEENKQNAKATEGKRQYDEPTRTDIRANVTGSETGAAAPPAAKPATLNSEPAEKRDVAKLKKEAETREQPVDSKDEDRQRRADDVAKAKGPAKAEAAPSRSRDGQLRGLSSVGGAAGRVVPYSKGAEDSEVRSIAGRRFRKEGSVWIDTAYDSSVTPTNVTRGSEQYRALVADEPGIRTIAEQLEGEIVLVWKSRTYRIR